MAPLSPAFMAHVPRENSLLLYLNQRPRKGRAVRELAQRKFGNELKQPRRGSRLLVVNQRFPRLTYELRQNEAGSTAQRAEYGRIQVGRIWIDLHGDGF